MILIPEIETVVILVPRTGTGSLRRAISAKYPRSMLIYRHMEADGVPAGYDRWQKVGVVRHPTERLWSLYKFLRGFGGDHDPAYVSATRGSAVRPFSEWIVSNTTVFTSPYDSDDRGRFWPHFTVRHPLPENRKSQFVYLRPDLGTRVFSYGDPGFFDLLKVSPEEGHNRTAPSTRPDLTDAARFYMEKCFAWDFAHCSSRAAA